MNFKHITLALAMLAGSGLHAQNTANGTTSARMTEQQVQERLDRTAAASDRTAKELGLNAEQATRMKEIDLKYSRLIIDARWSSALDDFDARFPRSAQRARLSSACKGVK